ncbi:MAG: RelA/SpoT family protein [bacterium]
MISKIEILYQTLVNKLKKYISDIQIIEKAFKFAEYHHRAQKRISGEPYVIHPLEVAIILTDFNMDSVAIASALLHDVVEDTSVKISDIYQNFGKEIGFIVESLTKLQKITPFIDKNIYSGTNREITLLNLKRLFVSTCKDIRVIIIKLADRLHNLRTIQYLDQEKQKRMALETLEFYVPIAQKLGIWKIKSEMEDIAFQVYDPQNYNLIKSHIDQIRTQIEQDYQRIVDLLQQKLDENSIKSTIQSRIKTVYSVYNKIHKRGVPIDQIMDIGAIRVILNSVAECYLVLGIIHNMWMPITDRIKDYIAKPKPNGYQSLHTVVYDKYPIEFQIRTWDMHYSAEYGIASHWRYKGISSWGDVEKIINNWKKELEGLENIENIADEVLNENVFVFTPKGDCIDLPVDSTPIDFAYKIHTEVGNKCAGCKVNGRIVPLDYKLQNGDIVEIITSKNSSPTIEWLKIAKTSYARSRIKQFLKQKNKKQYIQKAYEILSDILKSIKENTTDIQNLLNEIFERYYKNAYKEMEDFVLSIGSGNIKYESIESKVKHILSEKKNQKNQRAIKNIHRVRLGSSVLYRFAKCCNPVYPEPIIGYITRGNGISIHNLNCKNIQNLNSDLNLEGKLINLSWEDIKDKKPLSFEIIASDKKGLLQEILSILSSKTVNIISINAEAKNNIAFINLAIEIPKNINVEKLKVLLLKKIPNIIDIRQ